MALGDHSSITAPTGAPAVLTVLSDWQSTSEQREAYKAEFSRRRVLVVALEGGDGITKGLKLLLCPIPLRTDSELHLCSSPMNDGSAPFQNACLHICSEPVCVPWQDPAALSSDCSPQFH